MALGSPIAAWLATYGADAKQALNSAADDGFAHLCVNAANGELSPAELSTTGRRHLARYLRDLGLSLSGLAAEYPGTGLGDRSKAEERLDQVRAIATMAHELRVPVVSLNVHGLTSADARDSAYSAEILTQLAAIADRSDVRIAVHAPDAAPTDAAQAVRRLGSDALSLVLDTRDFPATDVDAAIAASAGDVWLRDVRRTGAGPEQTPFGRGEVNFPGVLAVLAQSEYRGTLVLRSDVGPRGVELMRQGRRYFEQLTRDR